MVVPLELEAVAREPSPNKLNGIRMNLKPAFVVIFILHAVLATAQDSVDKLLSKYNSLSVPYISVEELKMQQNNDKIYILDAREPAEFEVSHLKNALFVGYNDFSEQLVLKEIKDKSSPIVVYCSLGIRSEKIAEQLLRAGYTNVKNLYGGIFIWKNKGYKIFDASGKETEKVHAFSKHWSKYLSNGEKVY